MDTKQISERIRVQTEDFSVEEETNKVKNSSKRIGGIVTFRKWTDEALLRLVPDDRLLAESDAPYLAPVPHRGKRNEPAWVAHTVARLAGARGTDAARLGELVAANARRFFGLASAPPA